MVGTMLCSGGRGGQVGVAMSHETGMHRVLCGEIAVKTDTADS